MKPSRDQLWIHYGSLDVEELTRRLEEGELSTEARALLIDELRRRGVQDVEVLPEAEEPRAASVDKAGLIRTLGRNLSSLADAAAALWAILLMLLGVCLGAIVGIGMFLAGAAELINLVRSQAAVSAGDLGVALLMLFGSFPLGYFVFAVCVSLGAAPLGGATKS